MRRRRLLPPVRQLGLCPHPKIAQRRPRRATNHPATGCTTSTTATGATGATAEQPTTGPACGPGQPATDSTTSTTAKGATGATAEQPTTGPAWGPGQPATDSTTSATAQGATGATSKRACDRTRKSSGTCTAGQPTPSPSQPATGSTTSTTVKGATGAPLDASRSRESPRGTKEARSHAAAELESGSKWETITREGILRDLPSRLL